MAHTDPGEDRLYGGLFRLATWLVVGLVALWQLLPGVMYGVAAGAALFFAWQVALVVRARRRPPLPVDEFHGDAEIARLVAEHDRGEHPDRPE